MPKAFLSLNETFTVSPVNKANADKSLLVDAAESGVVQLSLIADDPQMGISFEISQSEMLSGVMELSVNDNGVQVRIDGVFAVSVRAQYINLFLDEDVKWTFGSLGGPFLGSLTVSGLEEEWYTYKRFGVDEKDVMYLVNVLTSNSKKDLM